MLHTAKQLTFHLIWLGISFSCNILGITDLIDCVPKKKHGCDADRNSYRMISSVVSGGRGKVAGA